MTAAATYYMAETYLDFSRALTGSERPADLRPEELEKYEQVLQEEATPFEQKAIDLHEKNLELRQAGVVNEWTEKSLGQLIQLRPGRYAKDESSSGFIEGVESYEYRSPVSGTSVPPADAADPAPGDDSAVDDANPE